MNKRVISTILAIVWATSAAAQNAPLSPALPSQASASPEPTPPFAQNTPQFPAMPGTQEQRLMKIVKGQGAYGHPIPQQNGIAALPPLTPPRKAALEAIAAPFTEQDIVETKERIEKQKAAIAHKPIKTIPRTRSISVDLSPGSDLPVVMTAPGEISTIVFIDSSGEPWPIATAPRVANPEIYQVEWIKDTPSIMISTMSAYASGNLTVFLEGLATPILVKLDHAKIKQRARKVDYRVDMRIRGHGPNSSTPVFGDAKIALYDRVMQQFLDGTPPSSANELNILNAQETKSRVWSFEGKYFLRTALQMRSAYDQKLSSSDHTSVYKLPPTPYITVSDMGSPKIIEIEIQ